MLDSVRLYIEKHHLLEKDKPVLVGLSGGADSVALLTVLSRLGYVCMALHCNFHLRGDESDRDEQFAKSLAEAGKIPFYSIQFDTYAFAKTHHLSIEMAARQLRYEWFEQMRIRLNAQAIAVAHHQDDSIETLLINLIRGSGIRGLTGIRPKNGYIVRPLLNVSREEIVAWLGKESIAYMTDSTNLSDEYTRNFIRLQILPLLESRFPAIRKTLTRTAMHLSEVEFIYLSFIEEAKASLWEEEHRLSIPKLQRYPAPKTVLFELLHPYGFSRSVASSVYDALEGESGKEFYSPSYRLIKDREELLLYKREEVCPDMCYSWEKGKESGSLPIDLHQQIVTNDAHFQLNPSKAYAYFDYDLLDAHLTLRRWRKSDWFVPFGMKGRKKLSDYFSDHKYTLKQKEEAWVLCSGEDIIWLVGERSDNRYRIHKETKRIFIVKKND